jgi:hypothetical protein
MAEKKTIVDFSAGFASDSVSATDWPNGKEIKYTIAGGEAQTFKTPDATDDTAITITGLGTFKGTGDSLAAFTADAGLAGTVSFTEGEGASITALDFGKTTGGINYALDGNDTVVALGLGADTVSIDAKGINANVNNYSYTTGDVILTSVKSAGALSNAGVFTIGAAEAQATVNVNTDGTQIYKAKVTQEKANYEYWTAVKDGTAKEFDASALGTDTTLVLDASSTTDATVTLGKGASSVSIGSGKVASGQGDDTINATGALTLSIGRNDGTDSISSSIKAADTVIFEGGRLSQVSVNTTNGDLTFGNTTVKGVSVDGGAFSAQFGTDATAGKLQFGTDIQAATDTAYFLGTQDASSLKAADSVAVDWNLGDSAKFKNIHFVSLSASDKGSVKLSNGYGDAGAGDTLYSAATDAVTITLGNGADFVSLNGSNDKQDTIVVSAVTGKDTIKGFKTGFKGDVLSLSNVSDLKDLYVGGTGYASMVSFDKDKSNYVSLGAAVKDDEGLLIKFAGSDTVKKVAADLSGNNTIVAGLDADIVLGAKDGKTLYSVTGGTDTDVTMFNFADATKYQNLTKFDLSAAKGQQIVVGTTDSDAITVGSASQTAAVWGGSSEADAISLNGTNHTTTHVWFSATDGSDTVENFNANDDVFFWGASTTADIAKGYTFETVTGGITITNKNDKHDVLTLKGNNLEKSSSIKVLSSAYITTATTDEERAAATTKVTFADTTKGAYATDSAIYVGIADGAAVSVGAGTADDEKAVIGVDLRGDKGIFDAHFYDVKTFDANKSYAQYVLIGSGESELRGGHTANIFWGGDSDSQTFVGSADATDYYWFGKGDGNDTATKVGSEDVVYLWSTNNIDDIKITTNGTNANVVYANENTLALENGVAALKGGLTFMLSDQKTTYTYDTKSQQFVKKA